MSKFISDNLAQKQAEMRTRQPPPAPESSETRYPAIPRRLPFGFTDKGTRGKVEQWMRDGYCWQGQRLGYKRLALALKVNDTTVWKHWKRLQAQHPEFDSKLATLLDAATSPAAVQPTTPVTVAPSEITASDPAAPQFRPSSAQEPTAVSLAAAYAIEAHRQGKPTRDSIGGRRPTNAQF